MKIVILDGSGANPGDLSWSPISALGELTVYDYTAAGETISHIGDAEIVLTNKTVIDRAVLDACPAIRYVGIIATGYNVVDLDACRERGIPVCNVPAYSTTAVAQHVFALLLELTNLVGHHNAAVQEGRWVTNPGFCFWDAPLRELDGLTLGIVGYGQIGQRTARIAEAFGMKVLACASRPREGLVSLEQVLRESDIISLHCPLTAANAGFINRETIAMMKPGAILINTARGGLLNEQDVRDALESGRLGACGLDVVSVEPMKADNPLLGAPNCLITPHIAWAPRETRARLIRIAADNVAAFMQGCPTNDVSRRN